MGRKLLDLPYYIFIWFIFPITFTFPILLYPPIANILLRPAFLVFRDQTVLGLSIEHYLIYVYLIGILSVLILSLIFRFTVKNKIIRILILGILIILSWLTWNPIDHTW